MATQFITKIKSFFSARHQSPLIVIGVRYGLPTLGWALYYTALLILIAAAFQYGDSDITNFEYKVF